MKCCTRCKISKPLDQFNRRAVAKDGRSSECKLCARARHRAFLDSHPDYKRDYYVKNRAQYARAQRKYKYGITDAELDVLEAKTCCDACGDELRAGHWSHIDHDHTTGSIRGVLCRHCNTALGFFKNDPSKIRRLAEYADAC